MGRGEQDGASASHPAMTEDGGTATPGNALPQLLTQQEVAVLFRRTPRALRNWEKTERLVPVRVGRSVFYRVSDIHQLLGLSGNH
jgi:hypothetical protein